MKRKAEAEDDLRATAESIARDVEHMARLEAEKLKLDPGDDSVDAISREVYDLAGEVRTKARAELELSELLDSDPGSKKGT
jgi:BMFP domain-containing protein YqiC